MSGDIVGRLRDEHVWEFTMQEREQAAAEIERLASLLNGVDTLHRRGTRGFSEVCDQCDQLWPCVTHVFLHDELVKAVNTLTVHK